MNNSSQEPAMNVLVSIIVPTYNREVFLERALGSALSQTFQDYEILVIDDASTDNTKGLVDRLQNGRIRYFRMDKNGGQCIARNFGIGKSNGRFIAFLDSDDEWLPTKLEKQVHLLSENEKAGAVYCGSYNMDDRTGNKDLISSKDYKRGNITMDLLAGLCPPSPSLFMVRSEIIKEVKLFDEHLITFVDVDLWLRISQKYEFDFVDEPLVIKHDHSEDQYISNFNKRSKGLILFTQKWESYMIEKSGRRNYHRLRSNLVETILIPVLQFPPADFRSKYIRILKLFFLYKFSLRSLRLLAKATLIYLLGPGLYRKIRSI
jgi:glycosyltransferase involved in cell wall biosynthesis